MGFGGGKNYLLRTLFHKRDESLGIRCCQSRGEYAAERYQRPRPWRNCQSLLGRFPHPARSNECCHTVNTKRDRGREDCPKATTATDSTSCNSSDTHLQVITRHIRQRIKMSTKACESGGMWSSRALQHPNPPRYTDYTAIREVLVTLAWPFMGYRGVI